MSRRVNTGEEEVSHRNNFKAVPIFPFFYPFTFINDTTNKDFFLDSALYIKQNLHHYYSCHPINCDDRLSPRRRRRGVEVAAQLAVVKEKNTHFF